MLKRNWQLFAEQDSPKPVIRVNWSSSFYYPLNYRKAHTAIATNVEEAVEAGGEAIICSLFLENKDEKTETYNISIFSEIVRQKEMLGIPLIGECYVVEHKDKTEEQVHDKVRRVSRIMVELGADLIKTFYTGKKFREVVNNTPVPVFTIGAEKLSSDLDVLKKAKDSVDAGARGIIFGRNIFMSSKPLNLIKALNEVMNKGTKIKETFEKYNLN
jgi:DhnA family fructose-bisphosphate aldolase class Ia